MATTLTVPNGSTNGGAAGVSLIAMQEQFAAMMAELTELKTAAKTPATLVVPGVALNPQAIPVIAKVAAQPVNAQVWKAGQAIKLTGEAATKTATSSGKPCGSKSPNGLCQKCNGPFHPVLHYSLQALLRLDGSEAAITHENWKQARFLGISTDPNYFGNVVIVGFGKDCINMRPKNAIALSNGLMGKSDKPTAAAAHIKSVLTSNGYGHLLAAE